MPITTHIELLDPADITILRDTRQRREIDVSDLMPSIKKNGVINPIVIDAARVLIAGERRLESCRQLGIKVPCRFAEDLSPIQLQIIEAEENFKRSDLSWQDQVSAIARIHALYLAEDPEWTMGETADAVSLSLPTISLYLTVHREIGTQSILEAKTAREAYNAIQRRREREAGDDLEELLYGHKAPSEAEETLVSAAAESAGVSALPPAQARPALPAAASEEEVIQQISFLDWAPTYAGQKFNLIHCDFPFGANMFGGEMGRGTERSEGYSDDKETYFELLECFAKNFENFASLSCHVMFWLTFPQYEATRALFRNHVPSLEFVRHPLIWGKSDNAGVMGDSQRDFRHTYEMALLARRGNRPLAKVMADFYSAPTDRSLHPSTKPEPMLRHFFTALCDEHTRLLDPTSGSGAALRAAESLGASRVLGLEIDEAYVKSSRQALRNARMLREASKRVELIDREEF